MQTRIAHLVISVGDVGNMRRVHLTTHLRSELRSFGTRTSGDCRKAAAASGVVT